jgi:ribosomal protein L30/L7E
MGGRRLMMSKVRDTLEGLGLSDKAERGVLVRLTA